MAKPKRRTSGRYAVRTRSLLLIAALLLLLGLGIGSTVALLQTRTPEVRNEFTYGNVSSKVLESFGDEYGAYIKRNVRVQNTGNTSAYIRVLLVFTWKDADGNVFVNRPEETKDFRINLNLDDDWILVKNEIGAYLYYKYPVAPGAETPILIDSLRQSAGVTGPENGKYALSAEIITDAIQANPPDAVQEAWAGVQVDEAGAITVQGGVSYDPPEE